jgi:aryl-phospho-beta-D-glucosidase BglC (GH1 family)
MDQEWFDSHAPGAVDEWTFSQQLGDQAQSVLQDHWNTWITEDDIRIISESGFNHIRIPVGYWAFIDQPSGTPYVSMGGQVDQITRVLQLAANYGLYAILDIHGLPGSQNGEQASGHVGYNNFYQGANQLYGDQTVEAALSYIAASPFKSIITALAVCNEPI